MKNDETPDAPDAMVTVKRGLEVLRAFQADRAPLGNAELVRRTQLSKAAVSRFTSTLLAMGFLTRASGGRQFQLGTRALSLGQSYLETSPLMRLARPHMQALADDLGVSTALAVGDHTDMLYVAYCKSANISTLRLGVGSMLPMAVTSVGRAYLWGLPSAQRDALMAHILAQGGAQGPDRIKRIRQAFQDLDTEGFCTSLVEYQRDVFGVAVPVRLGLDHTLMALNCGAVRVGATRKDLQETIVPRLKETGQLLQQALAEHDCSP